MNMWKLWSIPCMQMPHLLSLDLQRIFLRSCVMRSSPGALSLIIYYQNLIKLLKRQDQLQQLVAWATKKGRLSFLPPPYRSETLNAYALRSVRWGFNSLFCRPPIKPPLRRQFGKKTCQRDVNRRQRRGRTRNQPAMSPDWLLVTF